MFFPNFSFSFSIPSPLYACYAGYEHSDSSVPHRPLDKSLVDKILRGEYIDFCLLLPDFMYHSQATALHLRYLQRWLTTNRLSLNIAKTEFKVIGYSNQRIHALSNNQIDIEIDGKSIKRVEEVKSPGLFIDEHLSWTKHIEEISKKISSAIGALKRIRPFISETTALQIYQALILLHFDYCSPVWDALSVTLSDKLQKLQNRAARVISRSS